MTCYSRDELKEFSAFSYRTARKCGASEADARDIAQAAVISLVKAESSIEKPEAWLRTVIKRRHLDVIRYRHKRPLIDPLDIDLTKETTSFEEGLVVRLAAQTRLEELLTVAEEVLSPKELEAFNDLVMYPGSGYTLNEFAKDVAAHRDTNPATERTHLRRAAEKLRAYQGESNGQ